MPLFMTQTKFTEESLKALSERPSNRPEAVARVIEGYGGKVLHYYWVFGDVDVITIYESPDNESAMAALLTLSSGGAVESHRTTALLTNDEAMRAMERAGSVETGYETPREVWRGWPDEGGEG